MTKKQRLLYAFVLILFIVTTILGFVLYAHEKYRESNTDINIIKITMAGNEWNSNLQIKTLKIKFIDDNGNVNDVFNIDDDTYSTPYIRIGRKANLVSKSNKIKFFYEYDVSFKDTGAILKKSNFLELKYIVEDNNVVMPELLYRTDGEDIIITWQPNSHYDFYLNFIMKFEVQKESYYNLHKNDTIL